MYFRKKQNNGIQVLTTILMVCLIFTMMPLLPGNQTVNADEGSVWDGTADISWYEGNESEANYSISTAEEIAGLAEIVNTTSAIQSNFSGKTISLTDDIDLGGSSSGNEWTEISKYGLNDSDGNGNGFAGTFDGNFKEIRNIYINAQNASGDNDDEDNSKALFGEIVGNGTVKNVILKSGSIEGDRFVGGIVGRNWGTIENCMNGADVKANGRRSGGGIAGANYPNAGKGVIKNCYNTGTIENSGGTHAQNAAGGITGISEGLAENCYNIGNINGNLKGGIVGNLANFGSSIGTVDNCYTLTGKGDDIAGTSNASSLITNSAILSSSEMMADNFVTALGSAFEYDTYDNNNGYPTLVGQNRTTGDVPVPSSGTISRSGHYYIPESFGTSTFKTITINAGLSVTLSAIDTNSDDSPYKNLKIAPQAGTTLKIKDLVISNYSGQNIIGFTGANNTLILEGDNTLSLWATSASSTHDAATVNIPENADVTVTGSGVLLATSLNANANPTQSNWGSAIGANSGSNMGKLVIDNSTVVAKGGRGAAIGGGRSTTAGEVIINGGTVAAIQAKDAEYKYQALNSTDPAETKSFDYTPEGAALGGGYRSDSKINTITVNGGNVITYHNGYGAAIGNGGSSTQNQGCLDGVTVNGGNVTAISTAYGAAGIGGGYKGEGVLGYRGFPVEINGGTVLAQGHDYAEDIGPAVDGPANTKSIKNKDEANLYELQIPTDGLTAPYDVKIDNKDYYSGYGNDYADLLTEYGVKLESSDIMKADGDLYFWLSEPENGNTYALDINGQSYTATFDEAKGMFTVDSNTTLVKYSKTAGTLALKQKLVSGEKYGTLPTLSQTGYTFKGWSTDGTEANIVTSESNISTTSRGGVVNLQAVMPADKYTVNFNMNGDEGTTPSAMTVEYASAYGALSTLPAITPKTGYTSSWYTAATGGTAVNNNTLVTATTDHSLYLRRTGISYRVNFDPVAEGASVQTGYRNITFGNKYAFRTATYTGYTFAGWFTEETGGTEVTTDTTMDRAEEHTLYARWKPNEYTVNFDVVSDDASVAYTSKSAVYDSTVGYLPEPSRIGYTFTGWYDEETGGNRVTSNTMVDFTGEKTIYAQWVANPYIVLFVPNGGMTTEVFKGVTYGDEYGSLTTPSKTGYDFDGWYTSDIGGTQVTENSIVGEIFGYKMLYAHWSPKQSTVTYNANGGNGLAKKSDTVTYDSVYPTLQTPKRTGYAFKGWYTASSGGSKITAGTKVSITGNTTLYAQWTGTDNTLSKLTTSKSKLGKKHNKNRTSNTIKLKKKQASTKITAKATQSSSKIAIKVGNGKFKTAKSATVKVAKGKSKTVTVKVTAQNGKVKTYKVKVRRAK